MKKIEKIVAKLAELAAKTASGTASLWNSYQPKEPSSTKRGLPEK